MLRIILGVIVGFVAWSVLWIGADALIGMLSPGWYGAHKHAFENAMINKTAFNADPVILIFYLARNAVTTLICGYLAALVANEKRRTPLILGIVLVLVGLIFQSMAWNLLPLWYFIVFLLLLIPMAVEGGRLKRIN